MKHELLQCLLVVKDYSEGKKVFDCIPVYRFRGWGICRAVTNVKGLLFPHLGTPGIIQMQDEMERLFAAWPKFSGSVLFPVPATDERFWHFTHSEEHQFMKTEDFWEGDYGQLRKELLDFCIQTLQQELEAVQ